MALFSLENILSEVRRRRVIGAVALYIVGAFVVLQVADLAFPGLEIQESSIRYVWIGAILGLPVAVVFGWCFDLSLQGIRRTPKALEDPANDALRVSDYMVLTVLFAAIVAMLFVLGQRIVETQSVLVPAVEVPELPAFNPPEFSIAVFV